MDDRMTVPPREKLLGRFAELGIEITITEHPPVFTVEEARALRGQIPGGHCKNLFLKDKKGVVWLVVTEEDAVIDLKSLPEKIGSARLSFGNAELMQELLGVTPGSVTPFGLISDDHNRVQVVLDRKMMDHEKLNYHPLSNDATMTIRSEDLVTFIRSCGHEPRIAQIQS